MLRTIKKLDDVNICKSSVRYFAILQWLFFGIEIGFLVFSLYQATLTLQQVENSNVKEVGEQYDSLFKAVEEQLGRKLAFETF